MGNQKSFEYTERFEKWEVVIERECSTGPEKWFELTGPEKWFELRRCSSNRGDIF